MADSATVLANVFCKYLEYVRQYKEQRFHPLSVLIRKELRARNGTIEEDSVGTVRGNRRCPALRL
jgi:hypothetical protein